MKTKEQLMAPRLKVIQTYPFMAYKVGDIIDLSRESIPVLNIPGLDELGLIKITQYGTHAASLTEHPHLFRPAHWSDNRLPDEFPDYVICDGKVEKVLEVKTDEAGYVTKIVTDDYLQFFSADIFQEPATQEEYEAYKKANP